MPRRFQFTLRRLLKYRLRTLFIAATIICATLGAWRLYWYDLGPFVEAEDAIAGQPFKVSGRLLIWGQPEERVCAVCVGIPGRGYVAEATIIERTGLFEWSFEYTYSKIAEPGSYDLWITSSLGAQPAAAHQRVGEAAAAIQEQVPNSSADIAMPRPRFTIRSLLVAMVVVAAFFGGIRIRLRLGKVGATS